MSQESLNPEGNGFTETKEPFAIADLLAMIAPVLQETKEELFGLSELRARVELAKVFVVHTKEGLTFERTAFESVWAAVIGQSDETEAQKE